MQLLLRGVFAEGPARRISPEVAHAEFAIVELGGRELFLTGGEPSCIPTWAS